MIRSLYFNGAVENVISTGSSETLQLYFEELASIGNPKDVAEKMSKRFGAVLGVLNIITTFIDSLNVFAPSLDDLQVYKKINTDNLRALFIVDGYQMDMQEIIDYIES